MVYIHDRITIDPEIMGGKPTVRGRRITVSQILGQLALGETIEEMLTAYPILELEDIKACLSFASLLAEQNLEAISVS